MDDAARRERAYRRGRELRVAGRPDEAIREFESALAVDPDHAPTHAELALCACARDDHARAVEAARTALRLDPDEAFVHFAAGWCLRRASDTAGALPHAVEAVRRDPGNSDHRRLLAYVRLDLGDVNGALVAADESVALDPGDFAAHVCRADVLLAARRPADARAAAERARALAPDSYWGHLRLSQAAAGAGAWREAEDAAREALRIQPTSAAARAALLDALRGRNRLHRILSQTVEWFAGLTPNARLAFFVVTCGWALLLALAVAMVRWSAHDRSLDPVADVALRLDRRARGLLTPAQAVGADRLLVLVGGLTALLVAAVAGAAPEVFLGCGTAGAWLPVLGCVANCRPGWPRARLAAYAAALAAVGVCAVLVASVADWTPTRKGERVDDAKGGAMWLVVVALAGAWWAPDAARRWGGYPWSHRFDLTPRAA